MSSTTITSNLYIQVIEDVINKVRDEFIYNDGPGEGVLSELQGLWELKMMQAGVIVGNRQETQNGMGGVPVTLNPVRDLNVPYDGTDEFQTPTADLLFPPTPMQTPLPGMSRTPLPGTVQTPLYGSDNSSFYNMASGGTLLTANEYPYSNYNGGAPEMKSENGRPSQYMQPPPSSLLNQRPHLDVNVAYVESQEHGDRGAPHQPAAQDFFSIASAKRKRDEFPPSFHAGGYIPQQDGAGDLLSDEMKGAQGRTLSNIPQLDGPMPYPYDDAFSTPNGYNNYQGGGLNEDYNIVNAPIPNDAPVENNHVDDYEGEPLNEDNLAQGQNVLIDEDDEPLNEDDDEDDDDDEFDDGDDGNTTNLILTQFDKVTRSKNKWKCVLMAGIMHINKKDVLFNKATGEFDF